MSVMRTWRRTLLLLPALGLPVPIAAQARLCTDAQGFLSDEIGMATVVEPDTVDDWRTGQRTAGCRVTAAGLTTRALPDEARVFFDRVRAAGWSRTPDPRDAPREASLRFRRADVDCLFSFYSGGLLGTEAELRVDDARVPKSGEGRYNLLVLCVPAADPGGGHTPP